MLFVRVEPHHRGNPPIRVHDLLFMEACEVRFGIEFSNFIEVLPVRVVVAVQIFGKGINALLRSVVRLECVLHHSDLVW